MPFEWKPRAPCVLRDPEAVYKVMRGRRLPRDREVFTALLLNTKNVIVRGVLVSVGTINASIVHPREVFKAAVRYSAAALILVHNHPSGNPTPSQEDIAITKRLVKAGEILGIQVLDHVIIGDGRFQSLKELGVL